MKRTFTIICLLLIISTPLSAQDIRPNTWAMVDYLVYRLDYQSLELKHIYHVPQRVNISDFDSTGQNYNGLDVTIEPAGDFGGTTIRSVLTNQIVYKATTVWDGAGEHEFPTDNYEVQPGDTAFMSYSPKHTDLLSYFFREEDTLAWKRAWEVVQNTSLPNKFPAGQSYSMLCYLHYYSVGASDPTTAEWIFVVQSLSESIRPYIGHRWTAINGNLQPQPILSLATNSFFGDSLWIGTEKGAFFTSTSGEQWTPVQLTTNQTGSVPCLTTMPHPLVDCLCTVVGLGMNDISADGTLNGAVYQSEFDGTDWKNLGSPGMLVSAIAFNPWNPYSVWGGFISADSSTVGLFHRVRDSEWQQMMLNSTSDAVPYPITTITINPMDTLNVLVGTRRGLYITSDGGKKWVRTLESFHIASIIVDYESTEQGIIVATSGRSRSDGIWYSKDGGNEWNVLSWMTDIAGLVRATNFLSMAPTTRWHYYMAVRGRGVYESVDKCRTWNPINEGLRDMDINTIAIHPNEFRTLYLGTDSGVYKYSRVLPRLDLAIAEDDLAYWPPTPKDGELVEIYATVHNNSPYAVHNIEVVFADNADGMLTVVVPIDTLNIPYILPNSEYTLRAEWFPRGQEGKNLILVDVDSREHIPEWDETNNHAAFPVYLNAPPYQRQWEEITGNIPYPYINDIATNPFAQGHLYVATVEGAFEGRLTNKRVWEPLEFANHGVNITQIEAEMHPFLDWTVPTLWLGTLEYGFNPKYHLGRVMVSEDGGREWQDTEFPLFGVSAMDVNWNHGLSPYVAAYDPGSSHDSYYIRGNDSWKELDLTPADTALQRINCIAIGHRDPVESVPPDTYLGTENGLFIVHGYDGSTQQTLEGLNVVSLVVPYGYRNQRQLVYAATRGEYFCDGVYMSKDGGKTFEKVFSAHHIAALDGSVQPSATVATAAPHLYVAVRNEGIYESRNGGHSWDNITKNMNDLAFTCLTIDRNEPLIAYVGTESGIYFYDDPSATTVEDEHDTEKPLSFSVQQNYPNPFNSSTVIRYTIPAVSAGTETQVTIINTLGQEVRQYRMQQTRAGAHQVVWDGRDNQGVAVNSGMYIARIQHQDWQSTIKMLYVK